ncbi:hypothetical protein NDU88_008431 [Pleurodeles waltl]|uniref:Uncharacterized protein n=1 Tax=Pleurodeles waltl TaxID=8319 RepID=A0AAV7PSW8_PLEWA|nr:hypothetical protein NDU88_008431 [Pleurodeles waltl]
MSLTALPFIVSLRPLLQKPQTGPRSLHLRTPLFRSSFGRGLPPPAKGTSSVTPTAAFSHRCQAGTARPHALRKGREDVPTPEYCFQSQGRPLFPPALLRHDVPRRTHPGKRQARALPASFLQPGALRKRKEGEGAQRDG